MSPNHPMYVIQCDRIDFDLPHITRRLLDIENNWNASNPNFAGKPLRYRFASLNDIEAEQILPYEIPVGSIDFCNKCLLALGHKQISAINVPKELQRLALLQRKVYTAHSVDEIKLILHTISNRRNRVLVKPGDVPKRFETISVSIADVDTFLKDIPGPYFISEYLPDNIIAEWRIFFWRQRIVAARPYFLSEWVCPSKAFAKQCLELWPNAPTAGTIDLAILNNGTTALLEAHQFISCGTYGFEQPEILMMLKDAWQWEINQ